MNGSRDRRVTLLAVGLAVLALPGSATAGSLPGERSARPGPDILYAKRHTPPQLTNRRPWRARPILVSGTTAYRRGEFLYQDYLYDDNGAHYTFDPDDPRSVANLFSQQNGTYRYPTAAKYANNAADLVEFRVKPRRKSTAFRVSLNTLKDPTLPAFSIAIGGDANAPRQFPFGAHVRAPADLFLTVHPQGNRVVGALTTAGSGKRIGGLLPVRVDTLRRQVTVKVPHARWNPRRHRVRLAAGVGLWDSQADRYLLPGPEASDSEPGGAGAESKPAAFFNVAFRTHEPVQRPTEGAGVVTDPAWWRDRAQGAALRDGDISAFHAEVSFRKLARHVKDNSHVPKRGAMDRIYGSRFELSQGADFSVRCFPGDPATCPGQYQGRLQPYAIYIPKGPRPRHGYGMTLLLHSLSASYNQYLGTRNMRQYGERGPGSIVITPEARGPDEFYENYGAADVFDVWSDVAHRWKLNPRWTVTTGYSMGGIGTFKLAAQFPDLFARIHPTVGDEDESSVLASLRNVPVLMWNTHGDELVNDTSFDQTAQALDDLDYRYELDEFQPCANPMCSPLFPNHLQLAVNDQFKPGAKFLGTTKVDRNPAHVTYVDFPERNHPELHMVGDHAYWVSHIKPVKGATEGTVDAFSHGFGVRDPRASNTKVDVGTLEGGNLGTLVYDVRKKTWGPIPSAPAGDRLDLKTEDVKAVTINVRRAKLGCHAAVDVDTNGPVAIKLAGCARTVHAG
jgi:pimeloyl-ACP methyl ester carboxylesterase